MNTIVCEGTISQLADGAAVCSTGWQQQVATVPFNIAQIDPPVATAFFTGGFVLAIVPWATAWGFSKLIESIRRF
jgi:hypothetical protein